MILEMNVLEADEGVHSMQRRPRNGSDLAEVISKAVLILKMSQE